MRVLPKKEFIETILNTGKLGVRGREFQMQIKPEPSELEVSIQENLDGLGFTVDWDLVSVGVSDDWEQPGIHWKYTVKYFDREVHSGSYHQGMGHHPLSLCIDAGMEIVGWRDINDLYAKHTAMIQNPTDVELFYCLFSDGAADFDAQTFEDWAGDIGYNVDSIKAHKIYESCCETGRVFRRVLCERTIARLREDFNEY